MLEALGLLVGLPPRESEDLDEEPLRQAVSPDDRVGLGLAGLGQMHFLMAAQRDEAVALEAVHHLGYGRSREAEEIGQAGGHDGPALVGQRVDRLQVFLDRTRCHGPRAYRDATPGRDFLPSDSDIFRRT